LEPGDALLLNGVDIGGTVYDHMGLFMGWNSDGTYNVMDETEPSTGTYLQTEIPSNDGFWQYAQPIEYLGYEAAPPPPPAPSYEMAFEGANSDYLWTMGQPGNADDTALAMASGTSPTIAAVAGGYEEAYQTSDGALATIGVTGDKTWDLGLAAGTSPSIAALPGGGWEVAFAGAGSNNLWTLSSSGTPDNWGLGMASGTSPTIVGVGATGQYEVAYQDNVGALYTAGTYDGANEKPWSLGMAQGTKPGIAALPGGGWEVAFNSGSTNNLWTLNSGGSSHDWGLGLATTTSPSIAGVGSTGQWEATFQDNGGAVYTMGTDGGDNEKAWSLGMAPNTNSSITADNAGWELDFNAGTTDKLWALSSAGSSASWSLGVAPGTTPGIAS
jgi:hypothetical protein